MVPLSYYYNNLPRTIVRDGGLCVSGWVGKCICIKYSAGLRNVVCQWLYSAHWTIGKEGGRALQACSGSRRGGGSSTPVRAAPSSSEPLRQQPWLGEQLARYRRGACTTTAWRHESLGSRSYTTAADTMYTLLEEGRRQGRDGDMR